jgi:hypothetical protein
MKMSFLNYSNYPPGVTGNEPYFADDDAEGELCHRCEAILESDGACPECDRDALRQEEMDRRIAAYWALHEDDREGPPPEPCWPHLQD